MNRDELLRLYDRQYAETYDAKFLESELARSDTAHELRLLAGWLTDGARWLDVACGTGFFLSRFPGIERVGLDLSPAMLDVARRTNPGIELVEASYLLPRSEWRDAWDLVSCMWYAYGLVSSIADLEVLVANLAEWTSPQGRCFVPLADPQLIAGVELPTQVASPWPGEVTITGILWSYREMNGSKVHAHQIAPNIDYMREVFGRYFQSVELELYPPASPEWKGRRCAIVATAKRSLAAR